MNNECLGALESIRSKLQIKCSGIVLDSELTLTNHLLILKLKLRLMCSFYYFINTCPVQTLWFLYYTVMHMRLQHITVWQGWAYKTTSESYKTIQKLFGKLIWGTNQQDPITTTFPLFKNNIIKFLILLRSINFDNRLILMKTVDGL